MKRFVVDFGGEEEMPAQPEPPHVTNSPRGDQREFDIYYIIGWDELEEAIEASRKNDWGSRPPIFIKFTPPKEDDAFWGFATGSSAVGGGFAMSPPSFFKGFGMDIIYNAEKFTVAQVEDIGDDLKERGFDVFEANSLQSMKFFEIVDIHPYATHDLRAAINMMSVDNAADYLVRLLVMQGEPEMIAEGAVNHMSNANMYEMIYHITNGFNADEIRGNIEFIRDNFPPADAEGDV